MSFKSFLFIFLPLISIAQTTPDLQKLQVFLDNLPPEQISIVNDKIDAIEYLMTHPVSLNQADAQELQKIPFFREVDILTLLKYRKGGKIYEYTELLSLNGFTPQFVGYLQLVTTLEFSKVKQKNAYHQVSALLRFPFQEKAGIANAFAGSSLSNFTKYKGKNENLDWGLSFQKDEGEVWWRENHGPDQAAGYLQYSGTGVLEKIILGNFSIQYGQGIGMWSGFNQGFNLPGLSPERFGVRLAPTISGFEGLQMKGAAFSLKTPLGKITSYYSNQDADATLKGESNYFTTFSTGGLHRTQNEINKHNNLNLKTIGAVFQKDIPRGIIGIGGHHSFFNHPHREVFYPSGETGRETNEINNLSFFGNYQWESTRFFGEAAMDFEKGHSLLIGLSKKPTSFLDLSFSFQNQDENYRNFFAQPTLNATQKPGHSFHFTLSAELPKNLYFTALSRYQKFSVPGFQQPFPALSTNHKIRLAYQPKFGEQTFLQAELRNNEEAHENELLPKMGKQKGWILKLMHTKNLPLGRLKVEFIQHGENGEKPGYFWGTSFQQNLKLGTLTMGFRQFHTSYATRVYTYEDEVPLYYYSPMYAGQGHRFYVLLGIKSLKSLKLFVKYGHTKFYDRQNTGSGNDEREGPLVQDLKLTLQWHIRPS